MTPEEEPAIEVRIGAGPWRDRMPDAAALVRAAAGAALGRGGAPAAPAELSVLLTDDRGIARLNAAWRGAGGPTNVLSFPGDRDPPAGGGPALLGDVALSFETLEREARGAGTPLAHHVGHLVVHGVLHLLGHGHAAAPEAARMEALEAEILATLGIPDPYREPPP